MSIWMNQRVRTYDVVNPDNFGEVGTVIGVVWINDPEAGEDMVTSALVIQMDGGSTETSRVRDCRLNILDGEDMDD
jgi:hypothetical protein